MSRPKHQDKDLEKVLKSAEAQGWRIERRKGYYKLKCPCSERHLKTVSLTPSGANYLRNLVGQLNRATCWEDDR